MALPPPSPTSEPNDDRRDRPVTIGDYTKLYASGVSPRAVLVELQRRLEVESAPGVWITLVDRAGIEAQVAALEAIAARSPEVRAALPLYGVPFAVKDNIDVAGQPTTAACPAYRYVAASHSAAVERLVAAGAVCVGKTNLDQFATGLVGTRSPYGRPSSTFAADRISGGSSSGSAVAVSRGDVAFALGTDTAGSGRVPAGFNHIVGLKPTPGRISTRGVVPACRSIDCVSIFALTVADAAAVLAVVEGDDDDAYSAFVVGPSHLPARLRVGVPSQTVSHGDAGYGAAYEAAIAHLRGLGHEVIAIDFAPLHAVAELLYGGAWVAERHAVVEKLMERNPEAIDPTVRQVIAAARTLSATDAFRGLYALRDAEREARATWGQVDLLMVPTAPGHPRFDDVDAEPIAVNTQLGTYTNFVNLLGWCALALPSGIAASGLPFGVTFIAPHARDAALARFGATWQASLALSLGATTRAFPATAASIDGPSSPAVEATLPIAVVGAHLSGLPLNPQLLALGAHRLEATHSAPRYRLYALPATTPAKPGMVRVAEGGAAIALEVWAMPRASVGALLASIAAPLGLGSVELADGRVVHGFVCEAHAVANATDITRHGGWRAYLASLSPPAAPASGA